MALLLEVTSSPIDLLAQARDRAKADAERCRQNSAGYKRDAEACDAAAFEAEARARRYSEAISALMTHEEAHP